MPALSDSMEQGTILQWLGAHGDEVKVGDELCEIETDKATMTYESELAGVIQIVAPEGATVAVGEPIATIGADAPLPSSEPRERGDHGRCRSRSSYRPRRPTATGQRQRPRRRSARRRGDAGRAPAGRGARDRARFRAGQRPARARSRRPT